MESNSQEVIPILSLGGHVKEIDRFQELFYETLKSQKSENFIFEFGWDLEAFQNIPISSDTLIRFFSEKVFPADTQIYNIWIRTIFYKKLTVQQQNNVLGVIFNKEGPAGIEHLLQNSTRIHPEAFNHVYYDLKAINAKQYVEFLNAAITDTKHWKVKVADFLNKGQIKPENLIPLLIEKNFARKKELAEVLTNLNNLAPEYKLICNTILDKDKVIEKADNEDDDWPYLDDDIPYKETREQKDEIIPLSPESEQEQKKDMKDFLINPDDKG